MKANGEDKRQLTQLGGRMVFPDFSPDGEQVVFTRLQFTARQTLAAG